jgi:hypothetical protein
MLSARTAPRQRSSLHCAPWAGTSSRGVVGSAITAATAPAPQAAFIAGPGLRTAGDVMAPWATTVVMRAAQAAIVVVIFIIAVVVVC